MPKGKVSGKAVQDKIKNIHAEEPNKPMNAVIGKAYGMVRGGKKK